MIENAQVSIPAEVLITVVFGVVGFIIVSLIGMVGFFITRHFTKADGDRESVDRLHSKVGHLERAAERSKEADDQCRAAIERLREADQEMRERIVAIEARMDE